MGATSLAPKGTSVGGNEPCPRVDFDLLDVLSGLIVTGSCRAYSCHVCGPKKARSWVGASALYGRPERFIRLSLIPESFQQARAQLRDLNYRLRRRGFTNEWLWVIERNPKGTGLHAHVMQHGSYIPQADLQKMCGGRIPDIRKVRGGTGSVTSYAMKGFGVGGYALKGFQDEGHDRFLDHLALNGGRPVHHSRGFFRSASGERMTATAARKGFLTALGEGEEREWVRIPKGSRPAGRE